CSSDLTGPAASAGQAGAIRHVASATWATLGTLGWGKNNGSDAGGMVRVPARSVAAIPPAPRRAARAAALRARGLPPSARLRDRRRLPYPAPETRCPPCRDRPRLPVYLSRCRGRRAHRRGAGRRTARRLRERVAGGGLGLSLGRPGRARRGGAAGHQDRPRTARGADHTRARTASLRTSGSDRGRYRRRTAGLPGLDRRRDPPRSRRLNQLTAHLARAAMLALLVLALPAQAVDESELLPVDEAFVLQARAVERGRIAIEWTIAEGYYLYRHRTSVQVAEGGFKANPLELPPGKRHTDEFFGEVETYRGRLVATLTGAAADGVRELGLQVKY